MDTVHEISIVMPVYNAGRYLSRMIDSLLNQTFNDFELIIVDDGSTDGSSDVCDYYRNIDSRIKVIHRENRGLCNARNTALKIAKGDYICFCDDDDFYYEDGLEQIHFAIVRTNADLIKTAHCVEMWNDTVLVDSHKAEMLDATVTVNELISGKYFHKVVKALWNGAYKRSVIEENNIWFDESMKAGGEDYDFNLRYMGFINTVCCIDKENYIHIVRNNQSASIGYNPNRIESILIAYNSEVRFLSKKKTSTEVYVEHQLWYLNMIKTELSYKDCKLADREKINVINKYLDGILEFKNIGIAEVIRSRSLAAKDKIKWIVLKTRSPKLIYRLWQMRNGLNKQNGM